MTQVAGHLDFYGCLGAKGGAIYINEGHMILQGGSQDRVEKTGCESSVFLFYSLGGGEAVFSSGPNKPENTNLLITSWEADEAYIYIMNFDLQN